MIDVIHKIVHHPLYWPILILLFIFVLIINKRIYKIIGWFGEYWVRSELKKLPKEKYKILNDIMISVNNITHQIDHIVFSKYGIFVIETKQYNGYITGDKYDKKWVRHLKNKKIRYTNPIRQNYGHIKAICELLNIEESKVFNVVCVPSRAKLNINHDGELTRNYNIITKITSYNDIIIDSPSIYHEQICKNNITSKKVRNKHIKNINKHKNIDENVCPKCGNELVKRNGKYGEFIGCSNYPRCKYTQDINNGDK